MTETYIRKPDFYPTGGTFEDCSSSKICKDICGMPLAKAALTLGLSTAQLEAVRKKSLKAFESMMYGLKGAFVVRCMEDDCANCVIFHNPIPAWFKDPYCDLLDDYMCDDNGWYAVENQHVCPDCWMEKWEHEKQSN